MQAKRRVRELAVRALFLWDASGQTDRDTADLALRIGDDDTPGLLIDSEADLRTAALDLAHAAWQARETTDTRLEFHAPQWPVKRQPGVDRAILRLAVWELGTGETPPKVVIDEAIELAKRYSTEQSAAFVNGVLDAIHRENVALTSATQVSPRV